MAASCSATASAQAPAGPAQGDGDIDVESVGRLQLVFSFRTGSPHGHAGAPQVDGDTLFVLTPFPHTLFALDIRRPGAPAKWRYAPKADGAAEGLACCDTINMGPVVANGRVFLNTLDGHTIALDASSGSVVWDTTTAGVASGETLTGSPLVVDGKVFIGNSGDDYGARGWIAALDAGTGREQWRRYSTGSDGDVGIDLAFHPFYADSRGADRGEVTWTSSGWERGGGSVSGPIVYDPELHLLLHGTGHPAPWNPDQHGGDNKWTSGLFARDPDTGAARWFDQFSPHDLFALGSAGSLLSADRDWRGTARKLLIHPDPNGYVYVLDRTSGEILSAEPFATVNASHGVDLASGALRVDSNRASRVNTMTRDVCPGWPGAVSGASALSPDAPLLFIPVNRLCMDMEARNTSYIPGTAFVGANVRAKSPVDGMRGAVTGWDFEAGKADWTVPERYPVASGVLTTGGLVFYGTLDGQFKALDARSGRLLWQFQASSGIIGQPIAYRGADGRPYIAVLAGLGGPFGAIARRGSDKRDATADHGMANALADLPAPADPSGSLYVFGLP